MSSTWTGGVARQGVINSVQWSNHQTSHHNPRDTNVYNLQLDSLPKPLTTPAARLRKCPFGQRKTRTCHDLIMHNNFTSEATVRKYQRTQVRDLHLGKKIITPNPASYCPCTKQSTIERFYIITHLRTSPFQNATSSSSNPSKPIILPETQKIILIGRTISNTNLSGIARVMEGWPKSRIVEGNCWVLSALYWTHTRNIVESVLK